MITVPRVEGRVLLIRVEDPAIDQPRIWITPGGGCEEGESPRAAAIRELFEETGLSVLQLGRCVWRRRFHWRWKDRLIDSDTHYFLHQLSAIEAVTWENASDSEQDVFRENRWWSVDELREATSEVFSPRKIAHLLPSALIENEHEPVLVIDD